MATKKHASRKRSTKRRTRRVSGLQPAVVSGLKKHHAKKRRKRVSGTGLTGNKIIDALLGTAIGAGTGIVIDKMSPESVDKKIIDTVKVLGGAAMAYAGNKSSNNLVMGIGLGLSGQGMATAAKNFGIIQGVTDFMNGISDGSSKDAMLIEMNGLTDTNGTPINAINQKPVSVVSGSMPNVVSGF